MIHRRCWIALQNTFKLVCVLATLSLVIWCGYEYYKNEDVCEVLFKTFHEDEDSIYPELSFALPNRFNESALRAYKEGFNEHNYKRFLQAVGYWDKRMLDIDFKEVSMQLKDYELGTCFYETLFAQKWGLCKNDTIEIKRFEMIEFSAFSLHIPSKSPMYSATIKLKSSIFYDGIRPANDNFFVVFGYPNQLYPSVSSAFYTWPLRNNVIAKNHRMKFFLKSMEVLRRRQKKEKQCYDQEDYDGKIVETIKENVGCSPVMWLMNRSETMCNTKQSFQKIYSEYLDQLHRLQFVKGKKYLDPCLAIEKIQVEYVEDDVSILKANPDDKEEGWFTIEFIVLTKKTQGNQAGSQIQRSKSCW